MNQESNTLEDAAPSLPQPDAHWRRWPIVELLVLAAPTVAQMSSYTLMQFTDRWMLGRIGGTEGTLQAAAAGTAGITFFAVIGFGFGVLLVVNTLVSQSFGRQDLPAAGRYMWQGIWFAVVFGLATLLLYPRAEELFLWMGHAPQMARYEPAVIEPYRGTFLSVPVAEGRHVIALRYAPREVEVALAFSLSAAALIVFALTGLSLNRSTRFVAQGLGRTQAVGLESIS